MPKGSSKSTAAIQRLLEERRQYQAWIARLDAAGDASPGQVKGRVRADYDARLAAGTEELKAHAGAAAQAGERGAVPGGGGEWATQGGGARVEGAGGRGRRGGQDTQVPRVRHDESADGVVLRELWSGAGCAVALTSPETSRTPPAATCAGRRCSCESGPCGRRGR